MADDLELVDRVAVVTGGAGLIGAEIAALLARRGARVLIVDIDERRAHAVAERICEAGGSVAATAADVGGEHEVERAFARADALGGPVGVLVNCAAPIALALREQPAERLSAETWDEMIRVALRGTMLCCRAALHRMVPAGGGSIVNISSIHAYAGDLTLVAYPVAKAGIIALTRSIATQYGRAGVRCNAVCPGTIPPPGLPAAELTRRLRHQAVERPGAPSDIAQAAAYLASPVASFITGQALVVDGGVLCHLPSFADGGHVQPSS